MQIDSRNLHDPGQNSQRVVRNTEVSLNHHRIALQQQVVFHTAVNPQNYIATALADWVWHGIAQKHFVARILPSNCDLRETIPQRFQFATAQCHGSSEIDIRSGDRVSHGTQTIRPVGRLRLHRQVPGANNRIASTFKIDFIGRQGDIGVQTRCTNDRSRFCGEDRTCVGQLNVDIPMQTNYACAGHTVAQ